MLRRSLAIVLLCAHAAAAAHLALAAHVTADTGAVVDAQPACPQSGHGTDGIAHGHALQREETECTVVGFVRTAAHFTVAVAAAPPPVAFHAAATRTSDAFVPLAPLSVAPKASPPV